MGWQLLANINVTEKLLEIFQIDFLCQKEMMMWTGGNPIN